jgi:2-methylisocitrate lyase-like PEP mutase family enzyme
MHLGQSLRNELHLTGAGAPIEPFIGFYDCFSATIAAQFSANLFFSGYGFAASYYGLPDNGYISWSDMVQAVWRVRQILPAHRMLVDIDDGYADRLVACRVVRELEAMGVAMVMLEDQSRPRRCGHEDGKTVTSLDEYLSKLNAVLAHRHSICVLARTDATGDEIYRRVEAIQKTEADAVLVDGVRSLEVLRRVRSLTDKPVAFNQIAGGKSPRLTMSELRAEGAALHIYSTPLLFAAKAAMRDALERIMHEDGRLPIAGGVKECTALLQQNVLADAVHLADALQNAEAALQMAYLQMSFR